MRIARSIALALLISGAPLTGHAKCPFAHYMVEGRILLSEGILVDRMRVYLFIDGRSRSSDYPATHFRPDFAIPDTDGHFRVESWISTSSGNPGSTAEQCKYAEPTGDIFVTGEGIYGLRVRVTFTPADRRKILKTLEAKARLGPIQIEPLPSAQGGDAPK